MPLTQAQVYAIVALLSGVVWFFLCYYVDAGGLAGESMIPRDSTGGFGVLLLSGAATGLAVACLFAGAIGHLRMPWRLLLPFGTVPVGVVVFALFLWTVRLGFGYHTVPVKAAGFELLDILGNLLAYIIALGLYPLVYALALGNQWILHRILLKP